MTDVGEVIDEAVRALATRIAHDMIPLKGWDVNLMQVTPNAGHGGSRLGQKSNTTIAVENEGILNLLLQFFEQEDFQEQAIEALSQLQDALVESELQPWPMCLRHEHVMVPTGIGEELYWVCPDDDEIRVRVGNL